MPPVPLWSVSGSPSQWVFRGCVGNEITTVAPMHRRYLLVHAPGLQVELLLERIHAAEQLHHRLLQGQHVGGAGQAEAEHGGQVRDLAQAGDVRVRVAAGAAGRAAGADHALGVVHPQRLGVHAGQLGGHGYRVAGVLCGVDHANNRSRGLPWLVRCSSSSFSSASRSCLDSLEGTAMRSRASRSPCPPPFRRGAPRPLTRRVFPSVEPAGTFTLTRWPSGVGSSTWAPIEASANVTGTSTSRSSPRRWNRLLSSTCVTT